MDDCSGVTRTLLDSSGNGIHATRTASTRCAPGISGQGALFDEAKDRIEALNAPQFELDDRLAVAAWINPSRADNNRPIVLKRRNDTTAFSLRLQNNQLQFSVTLAGTNKTVTTRAPITLNQWSHVAGVFDGEFVFLFLNGRQVGQVVASGSIADVEAPIRLGSTTQTQHFVGTMDNVWISTNGVNAGTIAALACIRGQSTFTVSPLSSGPQQPGAEFVYDLRIKNNDSGSCSAREHSVSVFGPFPTIVNAFADPFVQSVPAGQTGQFGLHVVSSSDAEPATVPIQFSTFDSTFGEQLFGEVQYEVAEPTGCFVRSARELMIRRPDVVDDPIRTSNDGPASDPRTGAWTFGKLIEQLAPTPEQATDVVERVFESWEADQTVNSFTISARPAMRSLVLDGWPRRADGRIDIHRAPLRLLAIVNRFDLRDLDKGHAGEGRFVFGVLGPFGPMEFTMILEYHLPAANEAEALGWANSWHALSSHPFPSEAYNAALQALTERFAGRGRAPSGPNGSALATLRSNDFALAGEWQLREFRLDSDGFSEARTGQAHARSELQFQRNTRAVREWQREQHPRRASHRPRTVQRRRVSWRIDHQQRLHDLERTWSGESRSPAQVLAQHVQRVPRSRNGDGLLARRAAVPRQRIVPVGVLDRDERLRSEHRWHTLFQRPRTTQGGSRGHRVRARWHGRTHGDAGLPP